ncbi:MAG: tRNA pseudouridine(38-40) synthase TruA [Coriobacteriia bacterium]|nr:tRNA pseudouridine(38-40) synthase TruA [Coriobacteriia bacterium]
MAEKELALVLCFGYKGTNYAGYAKQNHASTVQGELERALSTIFRKEINTVVAGRTDTGVHAHKQYASFVLPEEELYEHSAFRIKNALNALLPDDIRMRELYTASPDFSARFSAQARHYVYRISTTQELPLYTQDFVWSLARELKVSAMYEASRALIGEHDFKSFCKAVSAVDKPTHRNVKAIELSHQSEFGEEHLAIRVTGNAFLHSMVRTIVGTLVEVGLEKREVSWVQEVLEARDRRKAGCNAPACGLSLEGVDYFVNALSVYK